MFNLQVIGCAHLGWVHQIVLLRNNSPREVKEIDKDSNFNKGMRPTHVYSSIIHNHQEVEAAQVSIGG